MLMCATCGRGMKELVVQELHAVCSRESTTVDISEGDGDIEGKLFFRWFNGSKQIQDLLKLRLVERLFIVVHKEYKVNDVQVDGWCTAGRIINCVMMSLSNIQSTLDTWRQLFYQSPSHRAVNVNRKRDADGEQIEQVRETDCDDTMKVIKIRVSVKVTGSWRPIVSQESIKEKIGSILSDKLTSGYQVVEGDADVTLNIMCSDTLLLLAVPITRHPLSYRSYLKSHGLRSTTCSAIVLLADVQPAEIVLDPLCGVGTLLLEASHSQPLAHYIGVDIDCTQLSKAVDNKRFYTEITASTKPLHIDIIHGDVRCLPILEGSVDTIITDLPFGQQHKVKGCLDNFYLQCCQQWKRLLSARGRAVLLISKLQVDSLLRHAADVGLSVERQHYITLGRTEAFIVCLSVCPST